MALSPFLDQFGFHADPFESTDAEQEPHLTEYFVPPPYFDTVLGDSRNPASQLIFAPRGGGKTAQRKMVENASTDGNFLCVAYDEFDEPQGMRLSEVSWGYHVNQICRRILLGILITLDDDPALATRLNHHQRSLLKFQVPRFLGSLSAAEHETAVRAVKNLGDKARDFLRKYTGPLSIVIDAVMVKLGLDRVELPSDLPEEAKVDESLRYHYGHLLNIAQALGFESTYVLVDRVDEIALTHDADRTYGFVRPLLTDLRTLDATGVAVKFFLWDQIESRIDQDGFRRDRVAVHSLQWTLGELSEMLGRRLSAYSDERIHSFNQLLCRDFRLDVHALLTHFAHGSPRDMIRCAKRIVAEETRTSTTSTCISEAAVWRGVRAFADERASELVRADYLAELRKVGAPTFTISSVGSDVFRITNEGARRKIQVWMRTGAVSKIDELPNQKDRPTHLFGVIDLRVAVAMFPATELPMILGNFVLECPSCKVMVVNDRTEISCPSCNSRFKLSPQAVTLLERVTT